MKCPKCGSNQIKVAACHETDDGFWRRRECLQCGRRFNTMETIGDSQYKKDKNDRRKWGTFLNRLLDLVQKEVERLQDV